jgi:serine phosphatase RsbU (regulator of sigma subunit)
MRQVVVGLIFAALAILLFITGLSYLFFILLPVCLSFITTRSQLSNLLHGTLLYDVLTIGLALIYFGGITGIQFFIHTPGFGLLFLVHGSPVPFIIVVTTTLAWVVILAPLYTYAQALIDQRFNRRNYEAARAIEAFTSTLREEIDLDKVRDGLLAVVQKTMHPQSVSVWVRTTVQEDTGSPPAEADAPHQPRPYRYINVAGNDPFMAYTLSHPSTMEVDRLQLASPLMHILKTNEVEIASLLVSQGELIGLFTLGPCLNREEYSRENRNLLNMLAAQVAPALRVAQMVQEQQVQVREHERIAQELRTAHFIQQSLLPKEVPLFPGWQIAPYYQPAREIGGDFYDFLLFEDGQLGLVIGDVSGKGIPAALVMANTHSMIRTAAQGAISPGKALAQVNELLYAEIPPKMFVTCFYALLETSTGRLRYANAGHNLPYRCHCEEVHELRATGMPLGLMPESSYEEREITLTPGENVLFYTDGLTEAHNTQREMFDRSRLSALLKAYPGDLPLIGFLLNALSAFTGEPWEQEDDVTMVELCSIRAD